LAKDCWIRLDLNQSSATKPGYPELNVTMGNSVPHDRYQTVRELSERLEVAEATVRQWIKSGELRAIDIGRGWRIADADLERFLKARETAPRKQDDMTANIAGPRS
jgi:excisionase family DNA binding protein